MTDEGVPEMQEKKPRRNAKTIPAGERFGAWTVLGVAAERSAFLGATIQACRCVCGTERLVPSATLRNGTTKSCGCLRYARYRSHART